MTYPAEKAAQASRFKNITLPPYVMIALTLIGIADAAYVAHGNYTGAPLWCPILDGCNAVINSPYSRVFGVPMSYFGFIYYLFMFGLAVRLAYEPFSTPCVFVQFSTPRWVLFLQFTLSTFNSGSFVKFAATASSLP